MKDLFLKRLTINITTKVMFAFNNEKVPHEPLQWKKDNTVTIKYIRRLILILPIIICGVLAIINNKIPSDGCYSGLNNMFLLFFGFLGIKYTIVLTLFYAYMSIIKKVRFDILPISTFVIIVALFFIIQKTKSFGTSILEARVDSQHTGACCYGISMTFYEDHKFILRRNVEIICAETGNYRLVNDTLKINRITQEQQHIEEFYYTRFVIRKREGIMWPLNENGDIDSTVYFNIDY